MSTINQMIQSLKTPAAEEQLLRLYGSRPGQLAAQQARYASVLERLAQMPREEGPVWLVSAPGRTEIGGNHTDHNRGRVLAVAVNLDTVAAVSPRSDGWIHVRSEGYDPINVSLASLAPVPQEEGTTAGVIRGVAARMQELGLRIGGFDAAVTSTVAPGSGLSSSAAFEVLTCAILDQLYNGFSVDFITCAKIGQYAENVYFGKPSGLLDQMASAAGGLVTVDFLEDNPQVERLSYDFAQKGFALVVVGTGGSHADLTADYAAIPAEMKQVAAALGGEVLARVPEETFRAALPRLRGQLSDRALLRAIHFYHETDRVPRQVAALREDRLPDFLREICASGRSSFMYLQNVFARPEEQGLSLALALAEEMLEGRGAWRVHGGGFAGTTLNFVPTDLLDGFVTRMEAVFGAGSCHVLDIRPVGAYVLRL